VDTLSLHDALPISRPFAGSILDGGEGGGVRGSLGAIGGALTLAAGNTYTGATHVGDGIHAASGKLIVANSSGSSPARVRCSSSAAAASAIR